MRLARRFLRDQTASTTLEWSLLLAAIVLPGFFVIRSATDLLVGHYQMISLLNSLPFP